MAQPLCHDKIHVKHCSKCYIPKELSAFHHDWSRRDGRHPQCKECRMRYTNPPRLTDWKFCSKCKQAKTMSAFHVDRRWPSGRHSICKLCRAAARKLRSPEPVIRFVTTALFPSRGSVSFDQRKYYDEMVASGVTVEGMNLEGLVFRWQDLD